MNLHRTDEAVRFERMLEPDLSGGCLLWAGATDTWGYGVFYSKDRKLEKAHRVSWRLHHGSPAAKLVLHRCDVRACVRLEHLFEGDHLDNVQDMVAKGRKAILRGEAAPGARLTEADVSQIRALRAAGATATALGLQYGICQTGISAIIKGRSWSHLPLVGV